MVTKNFKVLMQMILEATGGSSPPCVIPITTWQGSTVYISNSRSSGFPGSITQTYTASQNYPGIVLGSGTTAPTENDYCLESPFTSGLSVNVTRDVGNDANSMWLDYIITITNTSSTEKTISEVGYQQDIRGYYQQGSTNVTTYVCLLDRTILQDPLVLQASGYGIIKYRLKTEVV